MYCNKEEDKHSWLEELGAAIDMCVDKKLRLDETRYGYVEEDVDGDIVGEGDSRIFDLSAGMKVGSDGKAREEVNDNEFKRAVKKFAELADAEGEGERTLSLYGLFKQGKRGAMNPAKIATKKNTLPLNSFWLAQPPLATASRKP